MKHYIGFLKTDLNKMLYFTSEKKPTRHTHWYFGKVLGPYESESEALNTMGVLKRGYGYRENPVKHRMRNPLLRKREFKSEASFLKFVRTIVKEWGNERVSWYFNERTRRYVVYFPKATSKRMMNPGEDFHVRKFIRFMKELEKYEVGSCEYKIALARANEHMKSVARL
jgi:hypothetical protein